jgi:imidazolonepropionase-like amidohydrolase
VKLILASVLAAAMPLLAAAAANPAKPAAKPPEAAAAPAERDVNPAPARRPGEGEGPYRRLVIRGATLIDGTGAPPRGPVDIVVEGNRIADITSAGTPGLPMKPNREPRGADREIDATGMYVLPGFVDMHAHGGDPVKAPDLDYVYKLWLAHGVTTVRGVPLAGYAVATSEKARSARNEIAAPRIFNYQTVGAGWSERVDTPEKARAWVRWAAKNGVDGVKMFGWGDETPEIMRATIDEAKKQGLGTVAHLAQLAVAGFDGREAGEAGLGTITHFYGHFEALLRQNQIQPFPPVYNFNNEQQRFGEVAEIWDDIFEPGGPEWRAYLEEQKKNGVTFDPTFNIYAASRDLMRARNADWHATYTLPSLWTYYQSTRDNHGSYFFDWTTWNEVAWRNFYARYFRLINDYKNMGGRVTTGSDSGFIFKLYGFGYIEELELLQEAGFHPLEVIQSATINGAKTIYEPKGQAPPFGLMRRGMLADLLIVPENPLANLKTLYGTGHVRLNDKTNQPERVGGVKFTIKDGIVYDAKALLADVAATVAAAKQRQPASATGAGAQP